MRHRRIAAMRNFDALLDPAEHDEESLFALRDLIKDATDGEWEAARLSA
jgi:hypothetical protein